MFQTGTTAVIEVGVTLFESNSDPIDTILVAVNA